MTLEEDEAKEHNDNDNDNDNGNANANDAAFRKSRWSESNQLTRQTTNLTKLIIYESRIKIKIERHRESQNRESRM